MWLTNQAKGGQKALPAPRVSETLRLTRTPTSRLVAVSARLLTRAEAFTQTCFTLASRTASW
ncbi:hypothetical protein LIOPPNJA_24860 [Robbsia andropogonis]|nr:hypothetical protein [Robbsia andropogonis]MCP1131016.1 hypothetical protein [Robbsia andropogonis]